MPIEEEIRAHSHCSAYGSSTWAPRRVGLETKEVSVQ